MIRYVGCDYTRSRLDAFADGELPMGEQVLVETHLRWCQTCAARLEDTQTIGDALRVTARAQADQHVEHDDPMLAAMQSGVLAQAHTEYEQSFGVRVQELFSDMRLWWPALGATVAVALSVGMASSIWEATSNQQPASLAAMIENLADPGSNRNPQRLDAAMYMPRVLGDGGELDNAMLAEDDARGHGDEVAFVVALTREGTVGGYALLDQGGMRRMPDSATLGDGHRGGVLHAVRQSRFAPAQRPGGQVVAVNMVLLFAHTTVKASHQTLDLGTPLTRPVLAVPGLVARPPVSTKPAGLTPEGASSQENSRERLASPPLESAAA
jgi:hypothetical protein